MKQTVCLQSNTLGSTVRFIYSSTHISRSPTTTVTIPVAGIPVAVTAPVASAKASQVRPRIEIGVGTGGYIHGSHEGCRTAVGAN